jgi:hypothetical protein
MSFHSSYARMTEFRFEGLFSVLRQAQDTPGDKG